MKGLKGKMNIKLANRNEENKVIVLVKIILMSITRKKFVQAAIGHIFIDQYLLLPFNATS